MLVRKTFILAFIPRCLTTSLEERRKRRADTLLVACAQAENKQAVQELMDNAMIGREMGNFELPFMTKFGSKVEVLLNVTSRRKT